MTLDARNVFPAPAIFHQMRISQTIKRRGEELTGALKPQKSRRIAVLPFTELLMLQQPFTCANSPCLFDCSVMFPVWL
jgi:hypothetical protein